MAENKDNEVNDVVANKAKYKHLKTKKRNWCFILYEDSAPANWKELLQKTGLEIAISPLHNKDLDATGEPKKPHYHIILLFPGPTSGSVVWDLVVGQLNQPIPIPLEGVRGMYRYFTHKDNADKYQYSEKDIEVINGFDINAYADLTSADKSKIKTELIKLIRERIITEYADFIDALIELDKDDYLYIGTTNTVFFNSYITSIRHKIRNEQNKNYYLVDRKTGEIIDDKPENEEA